MPYRVDVSRPRVDALDRLVALGALDVEASPTGGTAALMPDCVTPEQVASALGGADVSVAPAVGRDDGSVWVLGPRPVRIGSLRIVPAQHEPEAGTLRLIDAAAFGTGLHPTTALCLEALDEAVQTACPESVLDVGTGSGVLALAALILGVPRAMAIDIDGDALDVAAHNARINGVGDRLQLARGGPETVLAAQPMVLANILAAPLIEMAPALVRCVGHQGLLVLSGIAQSLEAAVTRAYRDLGMRQTDRKARGGWVALVMRASW